MSENFPKPKQKPKTTAENPKGDVYPDSKSIDENARDKNEQGKETGASPTNNGQQKSTPEPQDSQEAHAKKLLDNKNLKDEPRAALEKKFPHLKNQDNPADNLPPSEIGEAQAKPELKGNYGQSLSNPEENSDPTKSELSSSPAPGSDPFANLRKKYIEPTPTETSKLVEPQESGDQSRP
ncbi:hypothetical protein H6F98_00080 [Microcoleus sp. FACHB-SPT15]|uniref:hypothetical protein n=1 Tax=Microcoleus sp. FACHB-SPT15 TaxID=2692830 RepID=UPI00178622C5|nr:hypothetical protein [Microcoleus sp. FACHB-SPT15]MBD1803876.1 hypothetical protein [Microcoleus sp. FACHB-SPT15]